MTLKTGGLDEDEQKAAPQTGQPTTPRVAGIHHLKFPVTDLAQSLVWYEKVFGATRIPQFDHLTSDGAVFAYILKVPGLGQLLELRLAPATARRISGFDPVVMAVESRADLQQWADFLNSQGVPNSGVLRGILGWLLVVRDPDGLSLRLYSNEQHEFDQQNSDMHSPWVVYPAES